MRETKLKDAFVKVRDKCRTLQDENKTLKADRAAPGQGTAAATSAPKSVVPPTPAVIPATKIEDVSKIAPPAARPRKSSESTSAAKVCSTRRHM